MIKKLSDGEFELISKNKSCFDSLNDKTYIYRSFTLSVCMLISGIHSKQAGAELDQAQPQ